jgi:phage-related protein
VIANKLAWIRDEKVKLIEFKKQDEPTFYNQVAADGETLDKEKWSVNIQKLKEQADEALNHLQKIEDFLT